MIGGSILILERRKKPSHRKEKKERTSSSSPDPWQPSCRHIFKLASCGFLCFYQTFNTLGYPHFPHCPFPLHSACLHSSILALVLPQVSCEESSLTERLLISVQMSLNVSITVSRIREFVFFWGYLNHELLGLYGFKPKWKHSGSIRGATVGQGPLGFEGQHFLPPQAEVWMEPYFSPFSLPPVKRLEFPSPMTTDRRGTEGIFFSKLVFKYVNLFAWLCRVSVVTCKLLVVACGI